MMTAKNKLLSAYSTGKFICVGLDTDEAKIPQHLMKENNPVLIFNKRIIDSTRELCGAYKINFAFYEADGLRGIENLIQTIEYIGDNNFVIGDAKRGDIGNTAGQYAKSIFDVFQCDAATVNPYMGLDTMEPFVNREDKVTYILGLTSNSGANDYEKEKLSDGRMLFQKVIASAEKLNDKKNIGVVFGATKLHELENNLELMKNFHLLIPGIGAQGGELKDLASILKTAKHNNFLINVSRSVIYKSNDEKFDSSARDEVISLNEIMSNYYE